MLIEKEYGRLNNWSNRV